MDTTDLLYHENPPTWSVAEPETLGVQGQRKPTKPLINLGVNIKVALLSYTMAFGDGPRNFEPWSSDVDDT
ncbi:UNVERIFIED_CONTAM: hypothetical protein NCL1_17189 [Trichonephila clavipes]